MITVIVDGEVQNPTHVSIDQTTLDVIPVLVVDNVLLKPPREIRNPVLPKPFPRDLITNIVVSYEKRENGEEHEGKDDEEGDE